MRLIIYFIILVLFNSYAYGGVERNKNVNDKDRRCYLYKADNLFSSAARKVGNFFESSKNYEDYLRGALNQVYQSGSVKKLCDEGFEGNNFYKFSLIFTEIYDSSIKRLLTSSDSSCAKLLSVLKEANEEGHLCPMGNFISDPKEIVRIVIGLYHHGNERARLGELGKNLNIMNKELKMSGELFCSQASSSPNSLEKISFLGQIHDDPTVKDISKYKKSDFNGVFNSQISILQYIYLNPKKKYFSEDILADVDCEKLQSESKEEDNLEKRAIIQSIFHKDGRIKLNNIMKETKKYIVQIGAPAFACQLGLISRLYSPYSDGKEAEKIFKKANEEILKPMWERDEEMAKCLNKMNRLQIEIYNLENSHELSLEARNKLGELKKEESILSQELNRLNEREAYLEADFLMSKHKVFTERENLVMKRLETFIENRDKNSEKNDMVLIFGLGHRFEDMKSKKFIIERINKSQEDSSMLLIKDKDEDKEEGLDSSFMDFKKNKAKVDKELFHKK